MDPLTFSYPEELRFTCTRCGDCCRGWNVALGPGEEDRLEELPWEGREADLVGVKPSARVEGRAVLNRREDGTCIYLGADNLCRLHEHFGEDTKPLLCRMFPFGFAPVADRIAIDVSFACRAVSEGRGAPLRERVSEWTRLLRESRNGETAHRFSSGYTISGELLWELEFHLVDLLSERSLSLIDRVRAVSEFMRLATTSDPRTEAARTLRQVMARGIPRQVRERPAEGTMDRTQRAVFFHYLFLLLNPTPPDLHRLTARAREREVQRRVKAAESFRSLDAHPWVDNRESAKTHRDVLSVAPGYLGSAECAVLVERYLKAKIIGQRFLREGEKEIRFLEAVPRLLLTYPVFLWTSKALAASEVEELDARRALRLLDRAFAEVRLSSLPPKQRKAWDFVLTETDLPVCAALDLGSS